MKNIAKTLEDIITKGLNAAPLPYKKGNSIRIGSLAIRHSKDNGYMIFDCSNQKPVVTTFSRVAALAIAKHYSDVKKQDEILRLDDRLQKFYNDSVFYRHTLENTSDKFKKNVTLDRLEVAEAEVQTAQAILEDIIFDS